MANAKIKRGKKALSGRGRKLPNVLSKKQLIKLFSVIEETEVFMACCLGLFCGLRISEACNLRKQDISLEDGKLKVVQGKGNKDRYVMIPEAAKALIEKWLRLNDKSEYFIADGYGRKIERGWLTVKFSKSLEVAGLRIRREGYSKSVTGQPLYAYSFHTLRHTYATYLLEKGIDLYYIQRSLGHADIYTTQVYAYVSNKDLKDKIDLAFGKKKSNDVISKVTDPLQLLQLRLANGEIGLDEYEQLYDVIAKSDGVC